MSNMLRTTFLSFALATAITAHTAVWAPGMYCRGGADPNVDDSNTNLVVNPLYDLSKEDWWFQHHRGCDAVPPAADSFLQLPANGEFSVELAHNRAFTTLSYNGTKVSDWPDGGDHPEDWDAGVGPNGEVKCLEDGAMHTTNQSTQGATAWAISYQSELSAVTIENLVVFSTLDHTPWKRNATYKIPDLQECPEGGCHCAWLWIPNGCGQPNMYMQGFKCKVTNASPTALPLAAAQPPVYCKDDASKCVQGAKQMLAWHQKTGNNIETPDGVTPNYNTKCGWAEGAQTDIFAGGNGTRTTMPTAAANATSAILIATSEAIQTPATLPTLSPVVVGANEVSTTPTLLPLAAAPTATEQPRFRHHNWHHWHKQHPKASASA